MGRKKGRLPLKIFFNLCFQSNTCYVSVPSTLQSQNHSEQTAVPPCLPGTRDLQIWQNNPCKFSKLLLFLKKKFGVGLDKRGERKASCHFVNQTKQEKKLEKSFCKISPITWKFCGRKKSFKRFELRSDIALIWKAEKWNIQFWIKY